MRLYEVKGSAAKLWVVWERNPLIAEGKVPLFWSGPPEGEMPFKSGSFSGDITSAAVFKSRELALGEWKRATGKRFLPRTMGIATVRSMMVIDEATPDPTRPIEPEKK